MQMDEAVFFRCIFEGLGVDILNAMLDAVHPYVFSKLARVNRRSAELAREMTPRKLIEFTQEVTFINKRGVKRRYRTFVDGTKMGESCSYMDGALIKRCKYVRGIHHGLSERWTADGDLIGRILYDHGKINGPLWELPGDTFGYSVRSRVLMSWRNGRRHGIIVEWHDNDAIGVMITYHNDEKHGFMRTFNEEGGIEEISQWRHGLRHGVEVYYNNGIVDQFSTYRNDIHSGVSIDFDDYTRNYRAVVFDTNRDGFPVTKYIDLGTKVTYEHIDELVQHCINTGAELTIEMVDQLLKKS